jgi:uncharacterized protein YoxC
MAGLSGAEDLDEKKLLLDEAIPGLGWSVNGLNKRVIALDTLVRSLSGEVSVVSIPWRYISDLKEALQKLDDGVQALNNDLDTLETKGGVASINVEAFQLHNPPNDFIVNCAARLHDIDILVDGSLEAIHTLTQTVGTANYSAFDESVSELTGVLSEAREVAVTLDSLKEEGQEKHDTISGYATEAAELKDAITTLKETVDTLANSVTSQSEESSTSLTRINEIRDAAEALQAIVEEYQGSFDAFVTALDGRVTKHESSQAETDDLISTLKEQEEKIAAVLVRAEDMLEGATNVGLATTFIKIKTELDTKVTEARKAFHWAVGFLALSALPVVFYLYGAAGLNPFAAEGAAALSVEFSKTIGLALLLVPTAWLARFAAARHSALFKLRENYAYKYSIAMGVEGFKKQAPEYESEIAAATFFELTFNPADRMGSGSDAHERTPNPVMDWVMRKVGMTHDGQAEGVIKKED